MFKTSERNERPGFSMVFENGWTISVQWHDGAYCSGRYNTNKESVDAEIAIWDKEGNWYNFGNDQVEGYCSPNQVLEWMNKVANM